MHMHPITESSSQLTVSKPFFSAYFSFYFIFPTVPNAVSQGGISSKSDLLHFFSFLLKLLY